MREFFSSNNSTIEHIEEGNIVVTRFIGDISDESYFQIWEQSLAASVEVGSNRSLHDQSQIGNVSFRARAKVVMKYLPMVKKQMGEDIKVATLTSESIVHKSGMKYLIKAFKRFSSLTNENFTNEEEAVKWLSNS